MKTVLSIVTALLLAVAMSSAAQAECKACGHACHAKKACGCQKCSCCATTCAPCQPQYEEYQMTVYDTVYESVPVKTVVQTTKFVPDTEPRIVPTTVCQTVQAPCAPACGPCAPAASCCQQVAVTCLQKVQVPVIREVPATEELVSMKVVEKRIPRVITCVRPLPAPCAPAPCAPAACGCSK